MLLKKSERGFTQLTTPPGRARDAQQHRSKTSRRDEGIFEKIMYNELPVQGETVEVERVRQRERERQGGKCCFTLIVYINHLL